MQKLKYFILGIICVSFISPILESICTIVLSGLEIVKGIFTLKITKINAQIRKSSLDYPDEPPHHQIGFVINNEEEEYEDDNNDY